MCCHKPSHPRVPAAALLLALLTAGVAAAPPVLTLEDAVASAVASGDPEYERFAARALALERVAVADAQLPDPQITGQVANVPVDTFEFDEDGMTQALRVGLRQEFPAGRTLAVRGERQRVEARAQRARRAAALRDIELATRNAWLDLVYHLRAIEILRTSRAAIGEQIAALAGRFATGRMHAQDVLRTELELALLDDRLVEHQRLADLTRRNLARYIGPEAQRPLPAAIPGLPPPRDVAALERRLVEQPRVQVADAQIEAAALGIELAEQAYRPAFALEAGYGVRKERSDLATIGITLSLPLFNDKRQDPRRAAAVHERGARQLDRDALLLDLRQRLEQAWASWQRLNERIALYHQALGSHAAAAAAASVTTYANSQTDFAELVRSQLAELDIELKQAELETAAAKAWAELAWLTGDPS